MLLLLTNSSGLVVFKGIEKSNKTNLGSNPTGHKDMSYLFRLI